jgi:hypothetical protein
MNECNGYAGLSALAGLISAASSLTAVLPYITANALSLEQDVQAFLARPDADQVKPYERLLVRSLGQCLSSPYRPLTLKMAKDQAASLKIEDEKAPWLLSMFQSIWHLRTDVQLPLPQQMDDRVAILVSVFNDTRFCELALRSIREYSGCPHCTIIVNNSTNDMESFKQHVTSEGLADGWFDTGFTHHGFGLQVALHQIAGFRYIATLDSDAVGIERGWLKDMLDQLVNSQAAIAGPYREPESNTLTGHVVHPCFMLIDRQRIGSTFCVDFRSFWPFWDVAGLLTWDCRLFGLPIATVPHVYSGNCAAASTLINDSVRHYWYTSRITGMGDLETIDGHLVGDIRRRLEKEPEDPSLGLLRKNTVESETMRHLQLPIGDRDVVAG